MESITPVIVSGLITGLFALISKQMEINHSKSISVQDAGGANRNQLGNGINFGLALRHVGILQLAGISIGYVSGWFLPLFLDDLSGFLLGLIILGTIGLGVGFYWIAKTMSNPIQWKHLIVVAIGTAITTFVVNSITFSVILDVTIPVESLPIAFLQPFVSMGIGGFVASAQQSAVVKTTTPSGFSSPIHTPVQPSVRRQEIQPTQSPYSLYGRSGEMNGSVIPISQNGLTIGRASGNQLRLREKSVSRRHAQILVTPSGAYIQDKESATGTFINDKKIRSGVNMMLKHGDIIEVGIKQKFEFRMTDNRKF